MVVDAVGEEKLLYENKIKVNERNVVVDSFEQLFYDNYRNSRALIG